MKKIIIILLFTAFSLTVNGQESAKPASRAFENKNSLQFELFGHGLIYSINYERIIFNGQKFKTTVQAGFSYYPQSTGLRTFWIPFSINELLSFNQHHLEFGIGHILTKDYNLLRPGWDPLASFRLGYRYQQPDGRFLFRAGFTPVIEYAGSLEYRDWKRIELYPLGGLAVGYSF